MLEQKYYLLYTLIFGKLFVVHIGTYITICSHKIDSSTAIICAIDIRVPYLDFFFFQCKFSHYLLHACIFHPIFMRRVTSPNALLLISANSIIWLYTCPRDLRAGGAGAFVVGMCICHKSSVWWTRMGKSSSAPVRLHPASCPLRFWG